ncbi:MAG: T9SS type A sorting domain-containing protein [Chitinophagales bacterium]|nr:T9SS type A sorting domain-containing protein [Chitinophagales bacterium]
MKHLLAITFLLLTGKFANSQVNWQTLPQGNTYWWEWVNTLYYDSIENNLIVAGNFIYLNNGDTIYHIAKWDGVKFLPLGKGLDNIGSPLYNTGTNILSICPYQDKLYVGGGFARVGDLPFNNLAYCLATWDGMNWDSIAGYPKNEGVNNIRVYNDTLYICGTMDSVADQQANGLIAYDGTSWHSMKLFNQNPNPNENNVVIDIAFFNGDIYLSGVFYDSTGHQHQMMRRQNGVWEFMPEDLDLHGGTDWSGTMMIYDNKLIVSGYFLQQWGNIDNNIMAWDGTQWHAMGGGTDAPIRNIFIHDDKLYAVGNFYTAGGVEVDKVAIWDGNEWCGLGGIFNNTVLSGAFYKDTLYVGGGFTTLSDSSAINIARFAGGNDIDTCGALVSISQPTQNNFTFSFFPNPTTTQLTITTSSNGKLTITNSLSQTIQTLTINNAQQQIPTLTFPSGIYFLTFQTEKTIQTKKLLVQHE